MATTPKIALHVYLDEDTHEIWHTMCEDTGASATAYIEAIGRYVKECYDAGKDPSEIFPDYLKTARKIDAQRRRRG